MQDSRWNTDKKLEWKLGIADGYIASFGAHTDRFAEACLIEQICNLLGVPWSVLAFSTVAKEHERALKHQKIYELEKQLADLKLEVDILDAQLNS